MIHQHALLAALAASLSAAAALSAQPPAEPAKQRQVCRGATKSLGSHIRSSRRCRTAQQWQEDDEAKGRLPASLQVTQGQNDGQPRRQPQ
jgi:hypothetical protein